MTAPRAVTWVLEPGVFPDSAAALRAAVLRQGHALVSWSDDWWSSGPPAHIPPERAVFRGSLENAARVTEALGWTPGALCPVGAFCGSAWYEAAREWLVHDTWHIGPAHALIQHARQIADQLGAGDHLFVRPDSPLKPFSGRVVAVDALSPAALDHGFYYDDLSIPVIAAPVRAIGQEWRFVIVQQAVVAGSTYDPATHTPTAHAPSPDAAAFAARVAARLSPPAAAYILDVCEREGELRLLELNPFGGADLYRCDPDAVVERVSALANH